MAEESAGQVYRRRLKTAAGVAVLAALFLGPPALVVARVLRGEPLYYETTVTVTQPRGVLVESGSLLAVWLLAVIMTWGAATGVFPRRI